MGYAMVAEIYEANFREAPHDFLCSLLFLCGGGRVAILAEVDDGDMECVLKLANGDLGEIWLRSVTLTSATVAKVRLLDCTARLACDIDLTPGAYITRRIEGSTD